MAVGLVCFAVFLPAIHNGLITWDDDKNIINNPYFRGFAPAQLKWMWTNHLMQHYTPLAWMTLGLDSIVWRQQDFGYHLTNILLHGLNAGLLFWLTYTLLGMTRRPGADQSRIPLLCGAAFAGLLFGLHPLRVESVAWVTERRDVLSGCFYLLTLLAYLRRFTNPADPAAERRHYWSSLALFIAAVLSKEITVTLPVTLLILDFYPLRRLRGTPGQWFSAPALWVWLEKVPFFAVSFADSLMTIAVALRHHIAESMQEMGWLPRLSITVYDMAFYLVKSVLPVHLSPLYSLTAHKIDPAGASLLGSTAVVLGVTGAAVMLRRRFPGLLTVWLIYAVTLLPVGGLVHNGAQIAADRYTYLSCMGWAVLAGAVISLCWPLTAASRWRKLLLVGVPGLLLVPLAWQTRDQIHFWHDSATFWGHVVAEDPSALALNSLGAEYYRQGDSLGALEVYRRAIAAEPSYAFAHDNLGGVYLDLHQPEAALSEFRITQVLSPSYAPAYDGSGNALLLEGKVTDAITEYKKALELDPSYLPARKNLAEALRVSRTGNGTAAR